MQSSDARHRVDEGLNTAKFKPGIQRGQRFVEGSWLTPIVNGYSRAIPIRCLSAFTAKSVPNAKDEPRTEVQACLAFCVGHGSSWMRPGAKRKRC